MINILLAFDEVDKDIGSFNQGCLEDYQEVFRQKGINDGIDFIKSISLNSLTVNLKLKPLDRFVFVAYSHGEERRLLCNTGEYISEDINIELFNNSFFYTVSCDTGKSLGENLIINGCKCFFGYKTSFNSWRGYKDFSECANYGFFLFLEGESTMDIYSLMIEKYNQHIDKVVNDDFFVAALLRENRDGLVYLGDDLTIEFFSNTLEI